MGIEKVLVPNKIYFREENCKYFIVYLHNGHRVKTLHIMLPKTSPYVESYDGQSNWMHFLKMKMILKTEFIASLITIKNF